MALWFRQMREAEASSPFDLAEVRQHQNWTSCCCYMLRVPTPFQSIHRRLRYFDILNYSIFFDTQRYTTIVGSCSPSYYCALFCNHKSLWRFIVWAFVCAMWDLPAFFSCAILYTYNLGADPYCSSVSTPASFGFNVIFFSFSPEARCT